MPRVARFKIAAVADLLRQLEYAPAETRQRQMDAAERLIADIDPDQNYPQDFITFRITGYRPDAIDEPVTFVGQALLPDLLLLVQALSEKLDWEPEESRGRPIALNDVAAKLHVSTKTIQRYRKQGLVCHYVTFSDGVKRLACFEESLQRFLQGHQQQVHKAAEFSRVDDAVEADIIRQARQLHVSAHLSLNEAAQRLAAQHDRAHETIRMILRRHDRRAADPIFAQRGPVTDREVLLVHRAWLRGIEAARMAERLGKSKPTIHRAINRRRRDLLRAIELKYLRLPTFDLSDAASVILAAPAVTSHLNEPPPNLDVIALLDAAHQASVVPVDVEHSLVAACNLLKMRTAEAIAALGEWPTSEDLDAIETDLRWTALLMRRLVFLGFPAALRSIEQNLHRPLTEQSSDRIVAMVKLGIEVTAQVIESLDPTRGQRLERIAAHAMDRALAKMESARVAGRAAARHVEGSIAMGDAFARLCPWEAWLNLRDDLRRHLATLDEKLRRAMTLRFGWDGEPPMTCAMVAQRAGMTSVGVVRLLQRAVVRLRTAARSGAC